MIFTPHDYQKASIELVKERTHLALFLEMGLGKTVITLSAIAEMKEVGELQHPVLIIAPLQVARHTWTTEAQKWDHTKHLRVQPVLGNSAQRKKALSVDADIYVVNRENGKWLLDECFSQESKKKFDMLVIDELSGYKNSDTQRFKSLKFKRLEFKRVLGLTGTPSPNGLHELWSQMYLIDGGKSLFQNEYRFLKEFFYLNSQHGFPIITPKKSAAKEIPLRMEKSAFSLKAADYLTLPDRIDVIQRAEPAPKEKVAMLKKLKDYLSEVKGTGHDDISITAKALQIANGAVYDGDGKVHVLSDIKIDVLEEIVEASQSPMLVFYGFKHDAQRIKDKFGDACRELKTPQDIEDWNNGKIKMFLLHPASAGHGLNLQQGGSTIVWYGLTYSLELYQQANARLHRQGQTKPVTIHHIVTSDSIDEAVMEALQKKGDTQESLMQSVKMKIHELSAS